MKRRVCAVVFALLLSIGAGAAGPARLKVALTFDDLPLNGTLPPGVKISDVTRDTLAVLKKYRVPPSYGFINARKLEGDADAALALRLWARAGNPLANHTYTHLNLSANSAEDFTREIARNEPVLELLMPPDGLGAKHDWRWLRYPYLHEGDTLEKRRAVRAYLADNHYRVAETTLDYEDYLWNSAHARCVARQDEAALRWLRESYLATAGEWMRMERELSRTVFGRDINHVLLLHLGSFSPHILPDLFALLKRQGYEIVTLEEAQGDPIYSQDPDVADAHGGTLVELYVQKNGIPWPQVTPKPRDRLTTICQ